jgi:hypothetical protein
MMLTTMEVKRAMINLLHVLQANKSQREEEDKLEQELHEDAEAGGRLEGKILTIFFFHLLIFVISLPWNLSSFFFI